MKKRWFIQILIIVAAFWLLDFIFHHAGVGETNYYYISKLANSILFATLWVLALNYKEHWKKIVYSFIFGTWISFYYLVSAYSGFVQFLGIDALYSPPPFVLFGIFMHPIIWWFFHAGTFYLGTEIASLLNNSKKR